MPNQERDAYILDFPNGQKVEDILKKAESNYSKSEIDLKLSNKADAVDVYSKEDADARLRTKADKTTTYTKIEVDTALANKADTEEIYTKSQVDTALSGKVDKITGKGLSANDYTDEEKTKLSGIEDDATRTIVDTTLNSTSSNPLQNKVIYDKFQTKVDKVSGRGLSTNDFTTALKTFLTSLKEGIYLDLNTNLDLVAEPGMYLMNKAMINVPENVSGAAITTALMLVLDLTSTRRVQIYIPAYQNTLINGCVYIREKLLDRSWTKWYEQGNGLGTAIAENSSLDDISEAGHYYCPSGTICGTLSGIPTDLSTTAVAFSMDTIHLVNANTRTQLIYPGGNDNGGIIYKRNRYGNSWRPWFKFSGTQN